MLMAALRLVPVWAWFAAAALAYNTFIENPRIARDAREGYVREAEKAALDAELREVRRQLDAAEKAATLWQAQLTRAQKEEDERAQQVESDIAEFKAKLLAENRSCSLSDSDIEWLRK